MIYTYNMNLEPPGSSYEQTWDWKEVEVPSGTR